MFPQASAWKMDKLTERDIPELVALFKAESAITDGLELSRKEMRNLGGYFEEVIETACQGQQIYFLARARQNAQLIGGVSFLQDTSDSSVWERSFWVSDIFRGRGYATQLTSAATEWVFRNGLAQEIQEMTRPDNTPSILVKERQGFSLKGIVPSRGGELRRDVLRSAAFRPQH